jgi:ferric-dicitrate binding protein FerR (iron transport regulator)
MSADEETLDLIRRQVDGSATKEDFELLQQQLRQEPRARRLYARYTNLDAMLGRSATELRPTLPKTRAESSRWLLGSAMAAAAALVAMGIWLGTQEQATEDRTPLAIVLFSEDCVWAEGQSLSEGASLPSGSIALQSGTAILRFSGGAELVLRGKSELELISAGCARLSEGDAVVRAPENAAGFQLLTPTSDLTDLGTEFAVKVASSGITELHVMEGEVAYDDARAAVVDAGHALRFAHRDAAPESITLDSPRFAELIQKANPKQRPDLMTVYEGFHFPEGSYAPAEIRKGKGWAGPWRLRQGEELRVPYDQDAALDMRIVEGRLRVVWPIASGRGGMLQMPEGKSFRVREMKTRLRMNRDQITYFSFMTHEPQHNRPARATKPQEGFRLTFRSTTDYWGECLTFGIRANLQPQIQFGPGVNFTSAAAVPQAQTLLWVGKIVSRASGEDEISFSIYGEDDALDYAEPAAWQLSSHGIRQSAEYNIVVLSSTGQAPRILDELRLGPTWRSVVPIKLNPAAQN